MEELLERINNKQITVKIFKYIINNAKKISDGLYFKNGEVRLGKTLLDGLLSRKRLAEELVIEKSCKKREADEKVLEKEKIKIKKGGTKGETYDKGETY